MRTVNLGGAYPALQNIAQIITILEEDGEITVINGSKRDPGMGALTLGALMHEVINGTHSSGR